jgi:hypothetical protein
VLLALVAQLVARFRAPAGSRRELVQRVVAYEVVLVLLLFGGGLMQVPAYLAATPSERRALRRRHARELARVRAAHIQLHCASTARGHGYRRNLRTMIAIRIERRIAQRRPRRLGRLKLAFVAPTREALSGAPP